MAGISVEPLNLNVEPLNLNVEPLNLNVEPLNLTVEPLNLNLPYGVLDLGELNSPRVAQLPTP
ncbi:MAG: hypothetical protein F6J98_33885 [Moorea sp. SIO4G2]|nr:hypothetical protein [Moorena sp. SIO4G2]